MRILLLTGMTPDARLFAQILPRLPSASVVPWLEPLPRETIGSYAERLATSLQSDEPTIVCGVSFGGIVARELALSLKARRCVIVSSARSPAQLPPRFQRFRPLRRLPLEAILHAIGIVAAATPRKLRTGGTMRLRKLAGESGRWYRWAMAAVVNWRPTPGLDAIPLVQVHGDCDTTFPIRYVDPDVTIRGGGHLLPMTCADEIVEILSQAAFDSTTPKTTRQDPT